MNYYNRHVFLCTNQKIAGKQCCANSGGEPYFDYMKGKLLELEIHGPGKTRISKSGCLGRCSLGPCLVIYPEGTWYSYSSCEDIDEIIETHLINNTTVTRLLIDSQGC
ncbi:(2Fe-2S) ferredoxin domain-containing protein [Legionella spiritensis]|uniref:(2Fe-2S) ferredoxin domain-containing protein n=1 Tax=Legionella spiritensis TaxID=452 RepID=UPI0007315A29|nr:(2Fe-2S) ferredoxin domain-containing protein [Legionella spiritensis]